jgi:ribosome-binding factor A
VIFLEDHSLERGDKMLILLNQLSADRKPDILDAEEEFAEEESPETDED